MVYFCGKDITDGSLIDIPLEDWYPLKVAKELFKEQHLCREKFADFLKQLWKECNKKH